MHPDSMTEHHWIELQDPIVDTISTSCPRHKSDKDKILRYKTVSKNYFAKMSYKRKFR